MAVMLTVTSTPVLPLPKNGGCVQKMREGEPLRVMTEITSFIPKEKKSKNRNTWMTFGTESIWCRNRETNSSWAQW
jgi:hypothetical protein